MSKAHTPGPWKLWNPDGGTAVLSKDAIVAHARWGEDQRAADTRCIPIEEAHANARLIAAAPDMLEALKIVKIALQKHYYIDSADDAENCKVCGKNWRNTDYHITSKESSEKLRDEAEIIVADAIAKATGGDA